jgi:hypothetical protein
MRGIVGVIVTIWLVLGIIAVFALDQEKAVRSCPGVLNVALTVVAGPLNWVPGLVPTVSSCPQPSRA